MKKKKKNSRWLYISRTFTHSWTRCCSSACTAVSAKAFRSSSAAAARWSPAGFWVQASPWRACSRRDTRSRSRRCHRRRSRRWSNRTRARISPTWHSSSHRCHRPASIYWYFEDIRSPSSASLAPLRVCLSWNSFASLLASSATRPACVLLFSFFISNSILSAHRLKNDERTTERFESFNSQGTSVLVAIRRLRSLGGIASSSVTRRQNRELRLWTYQNRSGHVPRRGHDVVALVFIALFANSPARCTNSFFLFSFPPVKINLRQTRVPCSKTELCSCQNQNIQKQRDFLIDSR